MDSQYYLTKDPIFFITIGFVALIMTAMPAALGQAIFLPVVQTLSLTIFLGMAVRQGQTRSAILLMTIWLVVQVLVITALTWVVPGQIVKLFGDGHNYRVLFVNWFYGANQLPASLLTEPMTRIMEIVGILVGAVLTGGLVGVWYLVHAVNLAGFSAGSLMFEIGNPLIFPIGLPLWTILRIAGYVGFLTLLAEPLLTQQWQVSYYLQQRRYLLLGATGLLLLGLLSEVTLPGVWQAVFGSMGWG
ncbi:MAG: hypothetical protein AAF639_38785 [Chloroflexota bacterium]